MATNMVDVYIKFFICRSAYIERINESASYNMFIDKRAHQATDLLFDLYHSDLATLSKAVEQLVFTEPPSGRFDEPAEHSDDLSMIRKFLDPSGCVETVDKGFLRKINRDRLRLFDDVALEKFIESEKPDRPGNQWLSGYYKYAYYESSHLKNQSDKIKSQVDQCLETAKMEIQSFLQSILTADLSIADSDVELGDKFSTATRALLLAAVSGSGKTQSVMNLLGRNYGLYLQACNLDRISDGIHSPRRHNGSADTDSLCQLVKFSAEIFPLTAHDSIEYSWVIDWIMILVYGRIIIFSIFCEVYKTFNLTPELTSLLWLKFQIQTKYDPFDRLFKLSCLHPSTYERMGEFHPIFWPIINSVDSCLSEIDNGKFYICLDEIQCDMGVRIGTLKRATRKRDPSTLFDIWNYSFQHLPEFFFRHGLSEGIKTVYSGTSLNAQDAYDALNRSDFPDPIDEFLFHMSPGEWPTSRFSTFPMISTAKEFQKIIDAHAGSWIQSSAFKPVLAHMRDIITSEGKGLRGRPRWPVRYIQAINESLNTCTTTKPQSPEFWRSTIREQARKVKDEIKADLRSRLVLVSGSKKGPQVLDELFSVVVRSYLLDRPTAFSDDSGAVMISQAFAVMKKLEDGSDVYYLQEHLAAEAGKEFFIDNSAPSGIDVEQKLLSVLEMQQDDMSLISKSSEWFLAWRLYRGLPRRGARLEGSTEAMRVPDLINLLKSAQILPNSQAIETLEIPDDAFLIEGGEQQIGHLHTSSEDLSLWLRQVRTGAQPVSTLFFPENNAGPDLLFALGWLHGNVSQKLIVVIQLKCGQYNLDLGIKSTDLGMAYTTDNGGPLPQPAYNERRDGVRAELRSCAASGVQILRVLVTTGVASSHRRSVERGSSLCTEYFLRCDGRHTKILFGEGWETLMKGVKGEHKKVSMTDLYAQA